MIGHTKGMILRNEPWSLQKFGIRAFTKTSNNKKIVLENKKPFSAEKGFSRGKFFL